MYWGLLASATASAFASCSFLQKLPICYPSYLIISGVIHRIIWSLRWCAFSSHQLNYNPTKLIVCLAMNTNNRSVITIWIAKFPFPQTLFAASLGQFRNIAMGTNNNSPLSFGCLRLYSDYQLTRKYYKKFIGFISHFYTILRPQ